MRLVFIIVLLAFAGLFLDDGEKEGRRGNELYQQGSFGPAVEAYRAGLSALNSDAPAWVRYALHNNLGAALLKTEDAAAAGEAFSRALAGAPSPSDAARTAYNAGNAAYEAEDLERALAYYRESLLREPDNEDAKFNYEFVKRRLDQQQQQQQQQQQNGDDPQDQDRGQQQEQNGEGDRQQDQQPSDGENERQDGGSDRQDRNQPDEQQPEQQQRQSRQAGEELSDEQALRILQALQNEEQQLLREVQRKDVRPRRVEKDW